MLQGAKLFPPPPQGMEDSPQGVCWKKIVSFYINNENISIVQIISLYFLLHLIQKYYLDNQMKELN